MSPVLSRRAFVGGLATNTLWLATALGNGGTALVCADDARPPAAPPDWLTRWNKNITDQSQRRYADTELGEELGWLVSPFLNGFYYGYLATRDRRWVEQFVDWTDAILRRAVVELDGYPGWPKGDGSGGETPEYQADSLLGEAMLLRPIVLMAKKISQTPALHATWGERARSYLELAERIFLKWDSRDCWREVKGGGLWVVPTFGISRPSNTWSAGYATRKSTGFSHPANKQNHIARWLLALYDVTRKPVYQERAGHWFELLKSRLRTRDGGKYSVWNYWDPAGPWDYRPDGSPRHWVGVHPNGGYYQIDVEGIVDAFEHRLSFQRPDIDRLIATNREYMWNQQMKGARFQRIDGEAADPRWKNSPGTLWTALVPYDETLRRIFLANHDPSSWGGLASTPWFLSLSQP